MDTLRSVFMLLLFQGLGTASQELLHLRLPGPVVGMVLLACWLLWRGSVPAPLLHTSDTLLQWLGLLFVPAGVGIVTQLALLRAAWFPVTISLVCSTFASLLVTAGVMAFFQTRLRKDFPR